MLHPLDFLGKEDDAELGFFPAMDMPAREKLDLMDRLFRLLLGRFEPVTIGAHIASLKQSTTLRRFEPKFSQ